MIYAAYFRVTIRDIFNMVELYRVPNIEPIIVKLGLVPCRSIITQILLHRDIMIRALFCSGLGRSYESKLL